MMLLSAALLRLLVMDRFGNVPRLAPDLARVLKRRGLVAIERLMGMVLTAIATEMMLTGVGDFFGR